MTAEADQLQILAAALDQLASLISGTEQRQADLPTPCRSWTVRDVIAHVVRDLANFAAVARGEKPDYTKPMAELGNDWSGAFASGRHELDQAWRSADLESVVPTLGGGEAPLVSRADQQIAEFGVHAWDLARATGQGEDLDPRVAAHGLQWARQNLAPQYRGTEEDGKAFGPEVAVPDDAPIYERLAGWFGRDPRWLAQGA
jgi:uncharacterized protein (TIGR03086 family)